MKRKHTISRREFLQGAALTGAGLALGGCVVAPAPQQPAAATSAPAAAATTAPAAETPAAAAATMLELYHDKSSWAANTDKVGEFAAEQAGIGFKSVPFPDTTTYQSTVRAALGTDKAPDLFTWWSGYRMEDIVKSGGAADLTSIWDKYLSSGEYSQGVASAYTFDNKIYAAPFLVAYWIVYYHKGVFEQNNLTPPQTWDEFMTLCDTLLGLGITPLAQTVDGRWPAFIMFEEMVLRTGGPDLYNSLVNGQTSYEDPKIVEAMDLWKSLIDKKYFTDPGVTFGTADNSLLNLFKPGKVAMIPVGDWYSASLVEAGLKPGTDYDAFIMPNAKPDLPAALFFETSPLLVSERGPNKADALKLVDWWMSAPAQEEWCNLQGFSSPNAQAKIENPVGQHIAAMLAESKAQTLQRYWEATPPDIVETAVDELSKFILNPDSEKEVLAAIQQKADTVWKSRA